MIEQIPQDIVTLLATIAIFEGILKAFALWRAARNNDKNWYIAIVFLNTVGILPLIYLLFISKKNVNKS